MILIILKNIQNYGHHLWSYNLDADVRKKQVGNYFTA